MIVSLLLAMFMVPAVDAPLADAAMRGDLGQVRSLLVENADVNQAHGDGSTALHWAAYRDDSEMARVLLEAGATVGTKTRNGDFTPLFMAARNGSAAIIELLLDGGSDLNAPNTAGTTPLMLAAAAGKPDAVKVLLDRGAEVEAKDTINGQTAVMFAAATNSGAAIKVLVEHGADLNAVSNVLHPRNRSEDLDFTDRDRRQNRGPWLGGLTPLHFAAREGQMAAVRQLVASGADVNVLAATDQTPPMTTAIINGHFDIGKFLLDSGAEPNLANTGHLTALFATIDQGWVARTWYPGANSEQETVGHLELMEALLTAGADPNARMGPKLWFRTFHGDWVDSDGATAFWRAAQSNDIPAMRLLVSAGADPSIPTRPGGSPLQVAAGFGYQPQTSNFAADARLATLKYLVEELGADVNLKDEKGYTPLHGAALMNDLDLINYLVSRGADVTARASHIYGRNDDTNENVEEGMGDSVADFANGPREWNLQYPDIVDHLLEMGSTFTDDCKAAQCTQRTRPERFPKNNN
jgi:ankyrin repeat protein